MKLNDRDGSILALPYVFSAYPLQQLRETEFKYRLEICSAGKHAEYFHYKDPVVMHQDLNFIEKWIQHVEMGATMPPSSANAPGG
jgi:hypothetical protein